MLADSFVRRPRRALVVAAAVAALLAAVAFSLAFRAPTREPADRAPTTADPITPPDAEVSVSPESTDPVATSDPRAFAASVARTLFDWDTGGSLTMAEQARRVLAVADPSGLESPGLATDVAAYLPTQEGWAFLKRYYTRQWIEIRSVRVPDLWPQAVVEAGADGLAPGTAALTVDGVRHREGRWDGDSVSTEHDVAFTAFVVCGPSYATCHLLRLSRLDEPLD